MACRSCGLEGVVGTCSMCYGDPGHNTDGEYLRWMEEQEQKAREERRLMDESEQAPTNDTYVMNVRQQQLYNELRANYAGVGNIAHIGIRGGKFFIQNFIPDKKQYEYIEVNTINELESKLEEIEQSFAQKNRLDNDDVSNILPEEHPLGPGDLDLALIKIRQSFDAGLSEIISNSHRRIAPPSHEHNPYQVQCDALDVVLKKIGGDRVPFTCLAYAYKAIHEGDGVMRKHLPNDDFVFFYRFILDLGNKQNGEEHNPITEANIAEARQRLNRLKGARDSYIKY